MPYKTFRIPLCDLAGAERELNDFLCNHRILAVDRHWVDQGQNSFWAVWVDYLDASDTASDGTTSGSKKRIDYREVLSPEDFEVFARLRGLRKEIAGEDGVARSSAGEVDVLPDGTGRFPVSPQATNTRPLAVLC